MKSKHEEKDQRYMLLFKMDSTNLFERISSRQHEYIEIFSLKRSRSVFRDIFENRYSKASVFDLSHCPAEVLEALDQFYTRVDELYWYLKHTQDMPNTIEDEVSRRVGRLGKLYDQLALFIDAELGGGGFEQISDEDIPSDDQHYDFFTTQGEKDVEHSQEEYLQPEAYPDPDEDEGETPDIK